MRMDKFTSRFQQALSEAQSLAVGRDHNLIEPAHLLAALLADPAGAARVLLTQAGAKVRELERRTQVARRSPMPRPKRTGRRWRSTAST